MEGLHPAWPDAVPIHPHLLFESLGWTVAWRMFLRDRAARDPVADPMQRATLLTVGVVGGALGAKLSPWLDDPSATWAHATDLAWLVAGRSVVGGFLGAWATVEGAKRALGVPVATGDAYVRALGYGLAVARLGCFFSGVTDGTHGVPTDLPWGMDLGDGVPRHPTALYESVFLLAQTTLVHRVPWRRNGDAFQVFLASYLAWRLGIEAWKSEPGWCLGLTGIQLQCALGLLAHAAVLWRRRHGSS